MKKVKLDKILFILPALKSYFLSQGEEDVKPIIWQFIGDDDSSIETATLGECFLYFIHSIASLFNAAILKTEGDSVEISEVYDVFEGLRRDICDRKSKNFFGMECRRIMLELKSNDRKKFMNEALIVYERILSYLEVWFPFNDEGLLSLARELNMKNPMDFERVLTLSDLLEVKLSDELISEIETYNTHRLEFLQKETTLSKKWVAYFNQFKSPNLLTLIENTFAISPNNCFCERIFSFMNRVISDDRNRISDETIEAELLIKFNMETYGDEKTTNGCLKFINFIKDKDDIKTILKNVISSNKYE